VRGVYAIAETGDNTMSEPLRLLLVSEPRSGTHMIRSILKDNPYIHHWWDYNGALEGVPGRVTEALKKVINGLPQDHNFAAMTHIGPITSLDLDGVKAWKDHWSQLLGLFNRVIFLERKGKLAQYCSLQIANRDYQSTEYSKWDSSKPREYTPDPIHVDVSSFLEWCENIFQAWVRIKETLIPVKDPTGYLHLYYEDLWSKWEWNMVQIYKLLKPFCVGSYATEWLGLRPLTFLQETRPLQAAIENWEEVKRYWWKPPY